MFHPILESLDQLKSDKICRGAKISLEASKMAIKVLNNVFLLVCSALVQMGLPVSSKLGILNLLQLLLALSLTGVGVFLHHCEHQVATSPSHIRVWGHCH